MDKNRQHKRINKSINFQFSIPDQLPKKWDMAVIKNISAGGMMFTVPRDMDLTNKTIELKIKMPELAPILLELEAVVLEAIPRANSGFSDIRVKFINQSEDDKKHLTVLENIINSKK